MKRMQAERFHVGLTPERVIDAALDLTRSSHLFSWSIRDLAGALGVKQSAIYHHVGGKDLLCRGVVERVLERVAIPSETLAWERWFRELLTQFVPLTGEFPGVAKWTLMHGPTIPVMIPIVEGGIRRLRAGGFGEQSGIAYSFLLNTAVTTLAMRDERSMEQGDGPRDHESMMAEFRAVADDSPEARELGEGFMARFAETGGAEAAFAHYFDYAVEAAISGVSSLRPAEQGTADGADSRA